MPHFDATIAVENADDLPEGASRYYRRVLHLLWRKRTRGYVLKQVN
jgi:hypothetical protein